MDGLNCCFFQSPVHQRTDCYGIGETDQRRFASDEDATTGTIRPGMAQIVGHRGAHFDRQWHLYHPLAFAPDRDQADLPVDIVQPQSRYFAASKPQPRQQKQNGIVALCLWRYADRRSPRHVGSAQQEGISARSIATTLQSLAHTLPDRCGSHRDGASAGEKSVVRCPRVLRVWR